MKNLIALALSAALLTGCASFSSKPSTPGEVAILTIRIGKDKAKTGQVAIEFYDDSAPATVSNFKKLARQGFYKGIAFHRVFPGMLVQAGDPVARGKNRLTVGTNGPGYTLPAEISRRHIAGAVATARLPDPINPARRSNGSQFYIALQPMPALDGEYTVFGHVIGGMEFLDEISRVPSDTNDNPLERVVIRSVEIAPRASAAAVVEEKKPQ